MSIHQGNDPIVLQCPQCGARTGRTSGKTQCAKSEHPPMVLTWITTGRPLTPQECQAFEERTATNHQRTGRTTTKEQGKTRSEREAPQTGG